MVTLYDLVQQESQYSLLSTSIPSLDTLLLGNAESGFKPNRILDFQAAAGVFGVYLVCIKLISSHLSNGKRVVIVDTLSPFPYEVLRKQPGFKKEWILEDRLVSYKADTFARLFSLAVSKKWPSDTLVFLNNFHELAETYKNEVVASYEEQILKFQIERNSVILQNSESTTKQPIPELPSNSDLLTVDPIVKFKTHVLALMNILLNYAISCKSIVVLVGHLDAKYEVNIDQISGEPRGPGRTVLGNSIDYNHGKADVGAFISARAVFYKDLYKGATMVYAVQVRRGYTDSAPLYFDGDEESYDLVDLSVIVKAAAEAERSEEGEVTGSTVAITEENVQIEQTVNIDSGHAATVLLEEAPDQQESSASEIDHLESLIVPGTIVGSALEITTSTQIAVVSESEEEIPLL